LLYKEILSELGKKNVKYLVIGGIAVNLYGHPRVTKDLDLMISFEKSNMDKFLEIIKAYGLKPRVPVEPEELADKSKRELWKKEKNMKVFSFYNPENDLEVIDIMIQDYLDFDKAYTKKENISDGSLSVSMISIDDLIKLKEIANRPRDREDIEVLKKLKELRYER